MALSEEERIENQVRIRVAEALSSAGMDEIGVAKEVLFWLPGDFVEYYRHLFLRGVKLGDGPDRSVDEGQIKAKVNGGLKTRINGSRNEEGEYTPGSAGGAAAGKRYRNAWTVRDEAALAEKRRVDRGLRKLMEREGRRTVIETEKEEDGQGQGRGGDLSSRRAGGSKVQGNGARENPRAKSHGKLPEGMEVRAMGRQARRIHRECGRVMSDDWARCPFCID